MAVIRFELDLSPLDDALYGLGGPSAPAFILDTSLLDGTDVLDGSPFLVLGVASSSLGGLVGSASSTVIVTVTGVASANLGGLVASASATVTVSSVASANLGGLVASAITAVRQDAVLTAALGGLTASATAVVTPPEPEPEPTPSGGRQFYAPPRRKKIEPLPEVEIPVIQPKRRYATASTSLNGVNAKAVGAITFSILDDDAEVLLMV